MSARHYITVISGGQTGADQAALFAARACGISTGGWAPKGYQTLAGPALWLKEYGLKEMPTTNYVARSIQNVDDSDATIAFHHHPSAGTDKTIGYALTKKRQNVDFSTLTIYKPIFVVTDVTSVEQQQQLLEFIQKYNVKILNICGHRETQQKWTCDVQQFLEGIFRLF